MQTNDFVRAHGGRIPRIMRRNRGMHRADLGPGAIALAEAPRH